MQHEMLKFAFFNEIKDILKFNHKTVIAFYIIYHCYIVIFKTVKKGTRFPISV